MGHLNGWLPRLLCRDGNLDPFGDAFPAAAVEDGGLGDLVEGPGASGFDGVEAVGDGLGYGEVVGAVGGGGG